MIPLGLAAALFLGRERISNMSLPDYETYAQPKKAILMDYSNPASGSSRGFRNLRAALREDSKEAIYAQSSVINILGESKKDGAKIYKTDAQGSELWVPEIWIRDGVNIREFDDKNVALFISALGAEKVPREIKEYVRSRSGEEKFIEEIMEAASAPKGNKLSANLTQILGDEYTGWVSDYLVRDFSRKEHSWHNFGSKSLLAFGTEKTLSALVSDAYVHRKAFPPNWNVEYADWRIRYLEGLHSAMPEKHRKIIEDLLTGIFTDRNEHCRSRQEALGYRIIDREELKRNETYICTHCYKGCTTVTKWTYWFQTREKTLCKEEGYPCLCIGRRAGQFKPVPFREPFYEKMRIEK